MVVSSMFEVYVVVRQERFLSNDVMESLEAAIVNCTDATWQLVYILIHLTWNLYVGDATESAFMKKRYMSELARVEVN